MTSQSPNSAVVLILRFRRMLAIAAQIGLIILSNWLAFWLRFDNGMPDWANRAFVMTLPWLVAIRGLAFIPFRLYEGLWRYTSIYDLQALIGGIATSSVAFFLFTRTPFGPPSYPRSIFVTDSLILMVLLGGLRMSRRLYAEYSRSRPGRRVLIFGAGDAGELIVRDIKNNGWYGLQPVGFIDDDREKVGRRIHNVPVLGTRLDLYLIVDRYHPDEVLIAIPRADPATLRTIVRSLEPFKLPIKTLPNLRDIIDGKVEVGQIRSLAVEDLLTRAPVGLDIRPVRYLIAGRRVMVTGAGGSIGSELCRQIASLNPAALVMFERYENTLHAIRLELEDKYRHKTVLHPVIGDVTDAERVAAVLREHRPELVFHAAAHKHVPLMEENPCEAIKNNVGGTRIIAAAAEKAGVDRFVLISTDKAVNPSSVMGASKRLAEQIVRAQGEGSGTSFSIVRFGNVLASNGSVVPRFMEQIRRGGPVTITHPEMKRFFMLIPEAVQLVLHAAALAESGATYVLEMGEQVKLLDMARDLIRLSGLVPEEDVKIEFIGLRPGEKLAEELVGPDEDASPSILDKILCVRSRSKSEAGLMNRVEELEAIAAIGDAPVALEQLRALTGAVHTQSSDNSAAADTVTVGASIRAEHGEQQCPHCKTGMVHRSRAKSVVEKIRKEFTAQRLYRCSDCGWRGWVTPLEYGGRIAVDTPLAPDLQTLDTVIRPVDPDLRPTFSPKNLSN